MERMGDDCMTSVLMFSPTRMRTDRQGAREYCCRQKLAPFPTYRGLSLYLPHRSRRIFDWRMADLSWCMAIAVSMPGYSALSERPFLRPPRSLGQALMRVTIAE